MAGAGRQTRRFSAPARKASKVESQHPCRLFFPYAHHLNFFLAPATADSRYLPAAAEWLGKRGIRGFVRHGNRGRCATRGWKDGCSELAENSSDLIRVLEGTAHLIAAALKRPREFRFCRQP